MDAGTKTAVVKTKDGTEYTIKFVDKTTVHGVRASADATATGTKDTFHGLKEGSDLVAHYTVKGTDKTAVAAPRPWPSRPRMARSRHLSFPATPQPMRARTSERVPKNPPR